MESPYRGHLETVLGRVLSRDWDLLYPEERAQLRAYDALSCDARGLLVRLLMRKGPWFRLDDLDYPEVADRAAARSELIAQGWCGEDADAVALAELLTREDLARWLACFGRKTPGTARRETLVNVFIEVLADPERRAQVHVALRPLMRLHGDLWELVFLLFFGTFEQDLAAFIRTDIGQLRFEACPLDPSARRFEAREDAEFLRTIRGLRDGLVAGAVSLEDATARALSMEDRPGVRYQHRFSRLLNALGQAWERRGDWAQAGACYGRSALPPARERILRIQAKQGDMEGACVQAVLLVEAPLDASESTFAEAFLRRHARKTPVAAAWALAHPADESLPERHLVLSRPAVGSVEEAALAAAKAMGWQGFFAENLLWNALFGLGLWEALFAPLPGAFIHPFQSAPLDVDSPAFYAAREALIQHRLAVLRQDPALILRSAEAKWGIANAFVNWKHLTPDMLEAVVAHLPADALCAVLETQARHPRAFQSGFPDLFLFRQGACALWEVKGPGDTLRPEQRRWLRGFRSLGVDAQVVWVAWSGES